MKKNFELDITRWEAKVKNVLAVKAKIINEVVMWGLEKVRDETIKNVDGPKYGYTIKKSKTGKEYTVMNRGMMTNSGVFPVPIITGFLKKSIKLIKISTVLGAVYSDHSVANYNRAIHYGYKKLKPRPFLQAAVDAKRQEILVEFEKKIIAEIRKVGTV